MRINPVEDWRDSWRWISVNCMILAGSVQGAWMAIPDDLRSSIPPYTASLATVFLLIIGIIGRLTRQGYKSKRKITPPKASISQKAKPKPKVKKNARD